MMLRTKETRTIVNKSCVPDVGSDPTGQTGHHAKSYLNARAQHTGANTLRMSGACT